MKGDRFCEEGMRSGLRRASVVWGLKSDHVLGWVRAIGFGVGRSGLG